MGWPLVLLGEVAEQIDRTEPVVPDRTYTLLGMRSKIGGPFARETKLGAEVSAAKLNRVEAGDFIYSRLFAWQGSFGTIPLALDGSYVSNEFPIFRLNADRVDPSFLVYWFGLPATQHAVEMECSGSTPGTRNRYKEKHFLALRAPLPPLAEQQRIVARMDRVAGLVETRARATAAMEADLQAMLAKAFARCIEAAPRRPMSEVAPLIRRPVEIQPDGAYPELGVRSFGRGTFHKSVLRGGDLSWQKLFGIEKGDLVFSNIKAWEGAFAVAGDDDHGRVGSHRYLTCVPNPETATADFLWFYLQSPEGLSAVQSASPGSADRNRTLGVKRLEAIEVPVPPLETQRWFDRLQAKARRIQSIRAASAQDAEALIPALLHEVFGAKDKAA
ncbi:MAG: hypothetical protein Q4615_19110 [Paracoccus aminovorans]|nr:hypothetical protein [Paracoccus aminovorans]